MKFNLTLLGTHLRKTHAQLMDEAIGLLFEKHSESLDTVQRIARVVRGEEQ